MRTTLLIFIAFIANITCLPVFSQKTVYHTKAIHPAVHTIRLRVPEKSYFPPVIKLGSDEKIEISFDIFADETEFLNYKLIHCNADWTQSQLTDIEYIDGFNVNTVEEGELSFNTYRNYVHYSITIPNEQFQFKVSGNYALVVFPENYPDNPILYACFSVYENKVSVPAMVTTRTDIDYNKAHQQLEFSIQYPHHYIQDPRNDLRVHISQNNRRDTEAVLTQPLYVKNNELVFGHTPQLIFEAGNEYRRFEMVNTRYPGLNVENIRYYDPYYHVSLFPDKPRYTNNYTFDQTQYGHFTIRQSDADDNDTESDYFVVHFSLDYDNPLMNGDIYIDGEFTNGQYNEWNRMIYNQETRRYEKDMYLKQGSYNYQYLFLPKGASKATPGVIEGNFFETGNEYLIKVYQRGRQERYDRLVGIGRIFSGK
ncbi:DUF5103 domain-containing protein [Coprobacter tertius]|uniref:DUF5103 domain-containing protein n=1 Tax=Coprobacter tertius TaxID=2944915 RepID=A0ABT1MLG8_9BACT|nr:DUF5103 domain-containing protein [Coprobacter tertius]MCP9612731.1 DUF5103 domain-containing protein [Coprobacter tertius]